MRALFSSTCLALMLVTVPALATETPALTDAGAAELKKMIEETIADYKNAAQQGQSLMIGKDISVTPKGGFYEVRIPDIHLRENNSDIQVGTVVINAAPAASGDYLLSVALPKKITWLDPQKKPTMELTLGTQKLSGAFVPALKTFTKIDAEYKNLKLSSKESADASFSITVDEFKNILNLTEATDKKTWSGYNDASVKGVSLVAGGEKDTKIDARIEGFSTKIFYDKINLALARDSREKLKNLYKDGRKPTPEEINAVSLDMINGSFGMLDGISNKFEATGISLKTTPPAQSSGDANAAPEKPIDFKISALSSHIDARGMQQEKGSLTLKTRLEQIDYTDFQGATKGMIPQSANLEIYLENLPTREIVSAFKTILQASAQPAAKDEKEAAERKQKADAQVADALSTLPGLLVKSGAQISIKDSFINAPDVNSRLEGTVKAEGTDIKTGLPAVGTITLNITGLDEALAKLQEKSVNDPEAQSFVQSATILQMFGQLSKTPDGKSLRVYKIDMQPGGKVLLNGADLSTVAGSLGKAP